ncbi:NADPH dehydrogenase NamA [Alkaliphilus hydrothermalis]|uniref:NADPH2 dehydrogenase n=1 Tax=Alkaliphilus hydrothermalis TaxID=1482730 RepID=A0ABS2NRZ9_9FIRM|nr:NADPH dehydrogenase NamA [Alkaliphilus hydrothermalis]MBM7615642.1 NADPH2 dehydrogenase [Alkaliphilus hydrothermalis]
MANLFSPMSFKNLSLKNRIVMAPMCQYSADEKGYVQDWHTTHYASRAVGGVGLIIIEATAVEPRGRISSKDLGIWEDEHIAGLKSIVDQCRRYGSRVGIQLAHVGRKGNVPTETCVAPSAIAFSKDYPVPHELSKSEIKGIVEAFKQAARRSKEAGFDIIEIHGAHGYLINEFLSPLSNQRKDEYGGNPENRARFLREIIEAIREVLGEDYPLILRVSAEDYDEAGNHPEDVAELINLTKEYGIDLVNVSSGAVVSATINTYPGYQITFSETIKKLTGIPTIAGGLITSPLMAEEIVSNGRGDMVYLGRELLRNPYWPLQAAKELGAEIEWPRQYERSKL